MPLDPVTCYRAMRARDARFDGRFFVGVSSTRIYCRPVCTVRPPKRENCSFFPSAAAAESAGYRPCLRCRPELAPGNASIDATSRLAQAAAALIEDGSLNGAGVEGIAARLGVSDRHLRRAFAGEFGVAPIAYAQTQRLLLAKRLLTDTSMPITEVALASGFGSVRRFNSLFKSRYRLKPIQLRQSRRVARQAAGIPGDALHFQLGYRPPYDWPALLAFLDARSVAGVEAVEDGVYRRTVRVKLGSREQAGWVEVAPCARRPALRVTLAASLAPAVSLVLTRLKSLMDLACHPLEVAETLGSLAARNPGLRVPGAFDGFEVAVRAILGQQVSVAGARTLAGRFAAAFGTPVETPFSSLTVLFPEPDRIARLAPEDVARLGLPGARGRSVVMLAQALDQGLELLPNADIDATLVRLRSLPGIGEWTAQYIAMRALAWPDAFPHTDLGVMRALRERSPKPVLAAGEAWRPWRAYAVMHLWQSLTS
ncbi:MAG: DNA-3-methyladenine glycosylase 2 [Gammaproteobacteria bacterium]|nr:DNA-3-methyladenine glycosylase 2 [Gammaproteobacteria bacterium]